MGNGIRARKESTILPFYSQTHCKQMTNVICCPLKNAVETFFLKCVLFDDPLL